MTHAYRIAFGPQSASMPGFGRLRRWSWRRRYEQRAAPLPEPVLWQPARPAPRAPLAQRRLFFVPMAQRRRMKRRRWLQRVRKGVAA